MDESACGPDCECRQGYELGEAIPVRRAAKGTRGVVLSVRLTPEQSDALAELAGQDGKYVSEAARTAIGEYIQRRTSNLSAADMPETVNLSETRFSLRYAR